MAEQRPADHWGLLVSELGASPPPTEQQPAEQPEQPPASDGPRPSEEPPPLPLDASLEVIRADTPPRREPTSRSARTSVRRVPQDWTRLASELGVEVPPEADLAPAKRESTETEPEPVEEDEAPFPTLETPAEVMLEIEEERAGGFEAAEAGPSREGHGRRRRRRRGGGRPDQSGSPETARRSRDDQPEARSAAGRDDAAQRPQATADRGEGEPSRRRSEESGPGRGKRRRRRRGSGRDKPDSASPAATIPAAETIAEPDDAEDLLEIVDIEEAAPGAEGAAAAEAPDQQADESAGAEKSLHRGIPSWEEVVGVVISANMASRAKNPDRRSSGRSRSGPRRGSRDRPAPKTD
jgi:hypothetical protein